MNYDNLIFGKNQEKRIVSIEPLEDTAEIFYELENGSIESKIVPNEYWILSNEKLGYDWGKLKGNLHYKWGKKFKARDKFAVARNVLRNKDIFSIWNKQESFQILNGYTYFKGMNPKDVSILSFDLETTGLFPDAADANIICISYKFRDVNYTETGLISYDEVDGQRGIINALNEVIERLNPSIICGHNIYSFDLPYLIHIAYREGVKLTWGRDGSELVVDKRLYPFRIDGSRDQEFHKVSCYGRNFLDTYFLSLRYDIVNKKYASYGLKPIIEAEGLVDKDRVLYDSSQIRFKYKDPEEYKKIKQYCIGDAGDALKLVDLMLPAYFYATQCIPKSFQEVMTSGTGSQLNAMMVRAYLQDGHSISKASDTVDYKGAISLGIPGIYRNAMKWDVISEYPSIMMEYKVYDKVKDPKAYLITFVEYFFNQKAYYKSKFKETKDKSFDDLQSAMKIFANSLYGFYSTKGLNFNYPEGAAFITMKGRETVSKAIKWATGIEAAEFIKLHGNEDVIDV